VDQWEKFASVQRVQISWRLLWFWATLDDTSMVRAGTMLAKIEFHDKDSRNLVRGTSEIGLMQSTPNNSFGVLSGTSLLLERCMYLNYRYLATVFHGNGLNRLNSERCMKGFALVVQFTFQPSRSYAQYDHAALFSVPDTDKTMTDALASVDKSMYPSVTSRELETITRDYTTVIIF
jgi:hypothetical protein